MIMFEYYEDENVEKKGGLRGSIPTRDIKVTTTTRRGHDKTRIGMTLDNRKHLE